MSADAPEKIVVPTATVTWTIASWNVNGLRAVIRKGDFQAYLQTYAPDVLCLSETKLSGANTAAVGLILVFALAL